jgi:opacity protein-like surface antigen
VRSRQNKSQGDPLVHEPSARRLVSGAILFTVLGGLSTVLPARAQEGSQSATPPPGKAAVIVFRVDRIPLAAPVPVFVNNEPAGDLANGTHVVATVNPGTTNVRIGDRLVSAFSFATAANQSYFLRVEAVRSGDAVRTEVYAVAEQEGRRAIAQSRLAGTTPVAPARPPAAQPAAAPTAVAATRPDSGGNIALIASAGSFKLSKENQTVAGLASTYDTTSDSVFSIEAEWRGRSGVAWGLEYFSYKNDLVTSGTMPDAEQRVYAVMLNGKYYFRAADWLYPFAGVGIGKATASYSGGLTGHASGFAYQGLAGAELRFGSIGIYAQYKYFGSQVGGNGNDVKVNGSGVLGGISISF